MNTKNVIFYLFFLAAAFQIACGDAIDGPVSGSCNHAVVVQYSFTGDSTLFTGITNFPSGYGYLACNSTGLYFSNSYRPLNAYNAECKFTTVACGHLLTVSNSYFLESGTVETTGSPATSSAGRRRLVWW